jgi:rubrerythrin
MNTEINELVSYFINEENQTLEDLRERYRKYLRGIPDF